MKSEQTSSTFAITRNPWLYYLVILIIAEKIIQHIVVTTAFYFNWSDIASDVVVSPMVLMVMGAIVDVLFMVSLWGLLKKRIWAIYLTIGLALFDFVGEFVAQGRVMIMITVSFLTAILLLILILALRRQVQFRI